MALRVRKDGRILCAAIHPAERGDTYIDDGLHYEMSVVSKVIGTEPMERHKEHGEWWWLGNVPEGVDIEPFYLDREDRRCRSCGCTDSDCSGCVARTGEPCHWVEKDLCSACEENRTSAVEMYG